MGLKRVNYTQYEMILEDDHNSGGVLERSNFAALHSLVSGVSARASVFAETPPVSYNSPTVVDISKFLICDPLTGNLILCDTPTTLSFAGQPAGFYYNIEVRALEVLEDAQPRTFIGPTGDTYIQNIYKKGNYKEDFLLHQGTAGAAPTVTTGYVKLAEVYWDGSLTAGDIKPVDSLYGGNNTGWTAEPTITQLGKSNTAHRDAATIDHPDGSIIWEKLATSLQTIISTKTNVLIGEALDVGVVVGTPVYKDIGSGTWKKASFMQTQLPTGLCTDVATGRITLSGYDNNFVGLTPGWIYMTSTGNLTSTKTRVKIGYATSATLMIIDIDFSTDIDIVISTQAELDYYFGDGTAGFVPQAGWTYNWNGGAPTIKPPKQTMIKMKTDPIDGYGPSDGKRYYAAKSTLILTHGFKMIGDSYDTLAQIGIQDASYLNTTGVITTAGSRNMTTATGLDISPGDVIRLSIASTEGSNFYTVIGYTSGTGAMVVDMPVSATSAAATLDVLISGVEFKSMSLYAQTISASYLAHSIIDRIFRSAGLITDTTIMTFGSCKHRLTYCYNTKVRIDKIDTYLTYANNRRLTGSLFFKYCERCYGEAYDCVGSGYTDAGQMVLEVACHGVGFAAYDCLNMELYAHNCKSYYEQNSSAPPWQAYGPVGAGVYLVLCKGGSAQATDCGIVLYRGGEGFGRQCAGYGGGICYNQTSGMRLTALRCNITLTGTHFITTAPTWYSGGGGIYGDGDVLSFGNEATATDCGIYNMPGFGGGVAQVQKGRVVAVRCVNYWIPSSAPTVAMTMRGGGVANCNNSYVSVNGCSLYVGGNYVNLTLRGGGADSCPYATFERVVNCFVDLNELTGNGGGVANSDYSMTEFVDGCYCYQFGGGVYNSNYCGFESVMNCYVGANVIGNGGGIYLCNYSNFSGVYYNNKYNGSGGTTGSNIRNCTDTVTSMRYEAAGAWTRSQAQAPGTLNV